MAKMTCEDFAKKFRSLRGDLTKDTPDRFILDGINWCFKDLPLVPKLGALFQKHSTYNLDTEGNWRWRINGPFRRLIDIPVLTFWTSTGSEPCRLTLCYKELKAFYKENGLVGLRQPGTPCSYTIETEDDKVWLVVDRPLDIPVIVDIIAQGFPHDVHSMKDEIEISSIAEHLMLNVLSSVWMQESEDFAFSGAIYDYLDNKLIPEAIQALNKRWKMAPQAILGENN